MNKDIVKKIRRAVARYIYFVFTWLFKVMPYSMIKGMTAFLLPLGFALLKRLRKTAMETLTIALGKEKTPAEIQQICKDCFYNAGRSAIEIGSFNTRPELLKNNMRFEGKSQEYLEAALKTGKGVLAISAHFGNFPLMLLHLSQRGYPTHAIIRPARDEKIEVHFQAARARFGLHTIHSYPRETCVRESIRALRKKELLIVLLDQNTGAKSGVFVDFFGQKAGTATGPIIFAMRTGAVILPMFTVREGDDKHKIICEPHFELEIKETDEETLQFNVQKITNIIERFVRAYPSEWGWMHKRFKSKSKS